jgi:hypothetical protein
MSMFDALRAKAYQIKFVSHAEAILQGDFPDAVYAEEASDYSAATDMALE